ncbi:L-alanine-DL-glutamate epimerase-like enolase superfamily enzyme [Luteimonas cucumeris]|uniref:Dipeptide epimerase n=1 Tax=Luteimonas cucumeris TaxID=985012 RepID=A0A562L4S0_9GAMM|nr:dipeptide epimerase [Luteimonas cucumeris]TWI02677.1 L-alanine-DL-glutamate epimerase-like enolase superfamily enzyme [Luteimonas cucumeris]
MGPAHSRIELDVRNEPLRMKAPFRITGYMFQDPLATLVTLRDGAHVGRGEASGVYYLQDTPAAMLATLESHRDAIEAGIDRQALRTLLPPGGARNALDCALWELESRRAGSTVWQLAGINSPKPLLTTFTVGADTPEVMAAGARNYAQARAIKLKLTGEVDLDIARVRAVRAERPDVWLGVDANQGYVIDTLQRLLPALVDARVALLEQPCARGREAELDGIDHVIPIAADESVQGLDEVEALVGRFDVVNIKLDKCGGLTEGLLIAERARALGLKVMVGNMLGTSWAMAPAFVLGQQCDVVDLDGPLFLASDHVPGVVYADGMVSCDDAVWGSRTSAAA